MKPDIERLKDLRRAQIEIRNQLIFRQAHGHYPESLQEEINQAVSVMASQLQRIDQVLEKAEVKSGT